MNKWGTYEMALGTGIGFVIILYGSEGLIRGIGDLGYWALPDSVMIIIGIAILVVSITQGPEKS